MQVMANELIVIRTCASLQEAELVKSVLESEHIHTEIPDEYAAGVQPFYGVMEDGIRVLVNANDLERAEELLNTGSLGALGTKAP
jgi:hypothetical protein